MKISVFILLCCITAGQICAQIPDLKVIASAGNSFTNENIQLDWTMGEPLILTLENPPVILTQGFHQPNYDFISSSNTPGWPGTIKLFPNPCSNDLNIQLGFTEWQKGTLEIIEPSGKTWKSVSFSNEFIDQHINTTSLPSGQYFVKLRLPGKNIVQNISFIKL